MHFLLMYINNHLHTERSDREKNKQTNRVKAIISCSALFFFFFRDVTRMDYYAPGTYFISKSAPHRQYCAINQMTP